MFTETIVLALVVVVAVVYVAAVATLLKTDKRANRRVSVLQGGKEIANVIDTRRFLHTRIGLLNHLTLAPRDGLLLRGVREVHTQGMNFPIDVVFLDRDLRVRSIAAAVAPGVARVRGPRGTRAVLELAAGSAAGTLGLKAGDRLSLSSTGAAC